MRVLIALAMATSALPAQAQERERRELSTDRPDKTESPYTVDSGRFQIELELASYTRDVADRVLTESFAVAPVNLKYGIGRDTDVQLIVEPYLRQRTTDPRTGARDTIDGLGDVTLRVKHNLWGDDGGRTALGVMPFVKLPTNTGGVGNGRAEFGMIVPLAVALTDRIGLGLMTEIDVVENGASSGYRATFINSATVAFTLTDRLGLYTELFTERGDDWIVTGDVGLTYAIGAFTQLDVGANIGLSRAADDLAIFAGVSRRF